MENNDINLGKSFSAEEINAILVCMSYYSLRNQDELIGGIDVGYGCELFSKLISLLKSTDTQLKKINKNQNEMEQKNDWGDR